MKNMLKISAYFFVCIVVLSYVCALSGNIMPFRTILGMSVFISLIVVLLNHLIDKWLDF